MYKHKILKIYLLKIVLKNIGNVIAVLVRMKIKILRKFYVVFCRLVTYF